MILPERVLGRAGAQWITSGEAKAPISPRHLRRSSCNVCNGCNVCNADFAAALEAELLRAARGDAEIAQRREGCNVCNVGM